MKLHLGCGKRILKGYLNIDAVHPKADMHWDRLDDLYHLVKLGEVEEILLIHVIEHLWPQEVQAHLNHWYELLAPGGKLVIEAPDIMKMAQNLLDGMDTPAPIFGDNPDRDVYACHKAGWCYQTLLPMLRQAGFKDIKEDLTQWHGKRQWRDFRVVATKAHH